MDRKVIQSKFIIDNQNIFIEKCNEAHKKISKLLHGADTTKFYDLYNIFAVTAGDEYFKKLFKELKTIIFDYSKTDKSLWMQSWINYHKQDQCLDWHDHFWKFHGYISIDPKKTKTIFKDGFEIENEVGNIYIGPCNLEHKVIVNKPYEGNRITLGFDVIDNTFDNPNISFIPL